MINKQTINLLKKEIANHLPGQQQASSSSKNENDINKIEATKMKVEGREFEGLNELLSDLKVKHMIKTVAGSDTHDLINNAMESINSKSTIDDKRADLSSRILQLHSNLRGKIDNINKDSKFTMALGIAGLNRSNIKLD